MSKTRTIKKLIIAGDGAVGKTTTIAILAKYFKSKFESTYFKSDQPIDLKDITRTRLIDFHTILISNNNIKQILQIWDLQGQRFMNPNQKVPTNPLDLIPKTIIGHTSLIILMFSLNDYASFEHLFEKNGWYEIIKEHISIGSEILLVGNKSDLDREVYDNIIETTCETYSIPNFIPLSATSGFNITEFSDYVYKRVFSDSRPMSKEFLTSKGTSVYLN